MSDSPQNQIQAIRVSGAMNFEIIFPVNLFDSMGELMYRLHRTQTIEALPSSIQAQLTDTKWDSIYDGLYEIARQKLVQDEPQILRPQRGGVAPLKINMDEVMSAMEASDATGTDDGIVDEDVTGAPGDAEGGGA